MSFLDITGAKPGHCLIHGDVGIVGGEFKGFVEFASGFLDAEFRNGNVGELAEAKSDGLVVVAFDFGEVAGSEGGLGGLETALEKNGGIVGGVDCCRGKNRKKKRECGGCN